jgi:hypothetical protein
VTAAGWEIMTTCELSISVMSAWARLAMDSTMSVPAAVSDMPTAAQVGRFFHAGGPDGSANVGGDGALGQAEDVGLQLGRVGGEDSTELRGINDQLGRAAVLPGRVLALHNRGGEDAVLRTADQLAEFLALVRGEGRDVDQAHDIVGADAGVGDDRSAVGVPDRERRAGGLVDDAGHVGGVRAETSQAHLRGPLFGAEPTHSELERVSTPCRSNSSSTVSKYDGVTMMTSGRKSWMSCT